MICVHAPGVIAGVPGVTRAASDAGLTGVTTVDLPAGTTQEAPA